MYIPVIIVLNYYFMIMNYFSISYGNTYRHVCSCDNNLVSCGSCLRATVSPP